MKTKNKFLRKSSMIHKFSSRYRSRLSYNADLANVSYLVFSRACPHAQLFVLKKMKVNYRFTTQVRVRAILHPQTSSMRNQNRSKQHSIYIPNIILTSYIYPLQLCYN